MPIANCIKGTNIEKKVNNKIKAGISEYQAVREVLIEEYNNLSDRLNSLRQDVGLPSQELGIEDVDVEAIQEQFDTQVKVASSIEYVLPQEPIETVVEVADEVYIKKEKTSVKNSVNFTGNYKYLTTDFVSDFWAKALKEKLKNSNKWKNFYSNFDINEKGIYLLNDDALTLQKINLYADENLKNYSIISKQLPNLSEEKEVLDSKQVRRDSDYAKDFKGNLHRLSDDEIILKNNTEEFIKVGKRKFESIQTIGNLSLFKALDVNTNSNYYAVNTKQPTTKTDLNKSSYLEDRPEQFIKVSKYLSQQEDRDLKGLEC